MNHINSLLSKIKFINIHYDWRSKLGLKIPLKSKSTLSGYDLIIKILSIKFKIPFEITISIFDYVSITDLCDILGASYDQLKYHVKKTGFETFKNQLSELDGYQVKIINKDRQKWHRKRDL